MKNELSSERLLNNLKISQFDENDVMRNDKDNVIVDLTFKFALGIVDYCELLESKRKYVLARQLLKSGTSIGANTREAQNAESKTDFIHKFKIAAQEADEAQYWLLLCKGSDHYPDPGNY